MWYGYFKVSIRHPYERKVTVMRKETAKKIRTGLLVAWNILLAILLILVWKADKNVAMQNNVTKLVRAYIIGVPVMIGTVNWLKAKEKE